MRLVRAIVRLALLTAMVSTAVHAASFVVFPKAGELPSPGGRFIVRNEEREAIPGDVVSTIHSLWLVEAATGRSRKLCDYVGLAAVGWSENDSLIITQYVGKQTSRVLVFPSAAAADPILFDKAALTRLVPVELRPTLRENDHVFVEGLRIESGTLHLRVWGRGQHDPNGFRWSCTYGLASGAIACTAGQGAP